MEIIIKYLGILAVILVLRFIFEKIGMGDWLNGCIIGICLTFLVDYCESK